MFLDRLPDIYTKETVNEDEWSLEKYLDRHEGVVITYNFNFRDITYMVASSSRKGMSHIGNIFIYEKWHMKSDVIWSANVNVGMSVGVLRTLLRSASRYQEVGGPKICRNLWTRPERIARCKGLKEKSYWESNFGQDILWRQKILEK